MLTAHVRYLAQHKGDGVFTVEIFKDGFYSSTTSYDQLADVHEYCGRNSIQITSMVGIVDASAKPATCPKCFNQVEKLIDVDAEDFSRMFWNGESWQKSEHVKFVRRICRQCCRD